MSRELFVIREPMRLLDRVQLIAKTNEDVIGLGHGAHGGLDKSVNQEMRLILPDRAEVARELYCADPRTDVTTVLDLILDVADEPTGKRSVRLARLRVSGRMAWALPFSRFWLLELMRCESFISFRTDGLALSGSLCYHTSFLYVTRCGVSASAPFRRRRSASYSLKFPSETKECACCWGLCTS